MRLPKRLPISSPYVTIRSTGARRGPPGACRRSLPQVSPCQGEPPPPGAQESTLPTGGRVIEMFTHRRALMLLSILAVLALTAALPLFVAGCTGTTPGPTPTPTRTAVPTATPTAPPPTATRPATFTPVLPPSETPLPATPPAEQTAEPRSRAYRPRRARSPTEGAPANGLPGSDETSTPRPAPVAATSAPAPAATATPETAAAPQAGLIWDPRLTQRGATVIPAPRWRRGRVTGAWSRRSGSTSTTRRSRANTTSSWTRSIWRAGDRPACAYGWPISTKRSSTVTCQPS